MADAFIAARGLHKSYRMGETTVKALDGVDLDIERGSYVAVIGASGSGKSTFMNLLGALDRPSEGSLTVDGENLAHMTGDELAAFRNRTIGFVFQQFNLLPRADALENVMTPLLYGDTPKARRRALAEARLKEVGLADRMDHRPSQLSGGQQQRVAIARALVNDPEILLADEPTGALDTKTTEEVLDLLDAVNGSGVTVIVVTHENDVAARAKRRIRFSDGRIVEDDR